MPERYARLAALALIVLFILALPLLISLFNSMQAGNGARTPTVQIAVAASPTIPPPSVTSEPSSTPLPTTTPGCPSPATPEPLWVDPVVSPTNLLSQKISVTLGRGREISVTGEAGTVTQLGDFSIARPVVLEVPLAPNAVNNLVVSGRVEYAPGCFYTLQTRTDRAGSPLVIVQQANIAPPSVTPILQPANITPLPPGTVFLKPFSQVFGLGQEVPSSTEQVWLYQASPDAPFQILAQQGAFTRLASVGGTLNFWTLNDNLTTTPVAFPQYDNSVEGQTVQFVSGPIFACEAQYPRPLILGVCQEFRDIAEATVVQRAAVDSSILYLVRFNNRLYWVSSNVLKNEPQ